MGRLGLSRGFPSKLALPFWASEVLDREKYMSYNLNSLKGDYIGDYYRAY